MFLELTASEIAEKVLIDVGAGSGCLGITAKLERSNLSVILSDISKPALNIAEKNADALNADVHIQQQSLLNGQLKPVDYIFANLPYVDKSWDVSPELQAVNNAEMGDLSMRKFKHDSSNYIFDYLKIESSCSRSCIYRRQTSI
ncbi:methyltransferase [Candidatus Minimicrobia naudis]|uniref:Methyltransferase n=1 Tax=Candidatus Minimicrobia naudis TaxID=2841263 RepID=A0A8F1SBI8_9BACT|nr:methyltransferase [Candidatus Minimicrobia naudis]